METQLISALAANLPEVYQPIYEHPELSGHVSRVSHDRLVHIAQVHDTLQGLLGRPIRVLDLGCAQGFFSLSLAALGATVRGVDFLARNIAVCDALAKEHPQLLVSFVTGRLEDVVECLETDQFDLVLGLSVFHHVVHEKGLYEVKRLLSQVATHCAAMVLELALREEPLYWGGSQPNDPRKLLDSVAFVHEIARFGTHLAPIARPMFVASNRYWLLGSQGAQFDAWSTDPHLLASGTHQGSRRYFFGGNHIVKYYQFDHPRGHFNRDECANEIAFLASPPVGFEAAKCLTSIQSDREGWIVVERLPGRLLLDVLHEKATVDHLHVITQILAQLAALEGIGLYHDDVRTWNILIEANGVARLIDYGSISSVAKDCAWPNNLFLAFLVFVKEVVTGVVDSPVQLRTICISPFGLPEPYQTWAASFWGRPLGDWTFKALHQALLRLPADVAADAKQELLPTEIWMKSIEEAIQCQKLHNHHVQHVASVQTQQACERAASAEAQSQQAIERAASAEVQSQQAIERAASAEAQSQQAIERAASAEAQSQQAVERAASAEVQSQQAIERAASAEAQSQQAVERAASAEVAAQHINGMTAAQSELDTLRGEHNALLAANHHHWQLAESRGKQIEAMHGSLSWQLTAPLRWVGKVVYTLLATPRKAINIGITRGIERFQSPIVKLIKLLLRYPVLGSAINRLLLRFPPLHGQLVSIAQRRGVLFANTAQPLPNSAAASPDLSQLTPRARQIHADLLAAMGQRPKGDA